MTLEETKERARVKAISNLLGLERDLKQAYLDIENGGNGVVGVDQLEIVVSATKRQIDVWQFILKSIDNG